MTAARGRRLAPDARREQILTCAARLFGEHPYAAVSTTQIATGAGVTRGLLHHYFGTKRELYLEVVRRLVRLPAEPAPGVASGPVTDRVAAAVEWFLGSVEHTGPTFAALTGGAGADADVEQILNAADTRAARAILIMVGLPAGRPEQVAAVRTYLALAKATIREWILLGTLSRDQARTVLTATMLALVQHVLPALEPTRPTGRRKHP